MNILQYSLGNFSNSTDGLHESVPNNGQHRTIQLSEMYSCASYVINLYARVDPALNKCFSYVIYVCAMDQFNKLNTCYPILSKVLNTSYPTVKI